MTIFDEVLAIREEINHTKQKIIELDSRSLSARGQIISDMPRGGVAVNSIEDYVIRKEKLQQQEEQLNEKICDKWKKAINKYPYLTQEEFTLMKYRFFYGLQWKKCTELMSKSRIWNENKTFRTYRNIVHKITPKNCA